MVPLLIEIVVKPVLTKLKAPPLLVRDYKLDAVIVVIVRELVAAPSE